MLYKSVKNFEKLSSKQLSITYGYKGHKTTIVVVFQLQDFHHIIGLHKLKDIKSKLGGSRKILFAKLKNGVIKASEIEKSVYYHEIRDRVELVCYLELILQNGFILHKNHRNGIIKYTRIDFDYLIKTEYRNKVVNIFLKKDSEGKFHVCNSIFYQTVNYVKNQRPLAILKFQLEKRSI